MVARVLPSMRRKLAQAKRVIASGQLEAVPAAWRSHVREALAAEIEAMRAVELPSLDAAALVQHLDACLALGLRGQVEHFRLFVPYLVGVHGLHTACQRLLGWSEVETMTLLQGLSSSTSAPTRELRALAALLADRPAARAVIEQAPADVVDRLDQADAEVASALRRWLDSWGFGCVGYDPGLPTLAEQPQRVAELVRDLLSAPAPSDQEAARQRVIAAAREELDPAGQKELAAALARAESVYPLREENLIYTDSLPGGLLRQAAGEVGRRLQQARVLRRHLDAVYLELDELRAFASAPADLAARADRRRREVKWVRANPGPLSYGPPEPAPPDLRGLPEPARLLNGAILWAVAAEMRPPPERQADGGLSGIGASAGRYQGRVRVVRHLGELPRLQPGEVLVCPITTPSWTVYFSRTGALVTDGAGVLSHAAIVAREHDVPAVVATGHATTSLRDGMEVIVDGRKGTVEVLAS